MSYGLTASSIAIGVIFGLTMPVIANYLPIKTAMGVNLRTSLDQTFDEGQPRQNDCVHLWKGDISAA